MTGQFSRGGSNKSFPGIFEGGSDKSFPRLFEGGGSNESFPTKIGGGFINPGGRNYPYNFTLSVQNYMSFIFLWGKLDPGGNFPPQETSRLNTVQLPFSFDDIK